MRPAYPIIGRNPVVCGRKFCAGCGRWRQIVDFSCHKRDPLQVNARCYACVRIGHNTASERERERRREYNRLYAERKRRERGVPTRDLYTAQQIAESAPILGRRNCLRCTRWRHVSDFGHHRGKMRSVCAACLRVADRKAKAERTAEQRELRREYDRIYKDGLRRKAGIPQRNLTREPPPDPAWNRNGFARRVSTDPLRPHVAVWLRAYAFEHNLNGSGMHAGTKALAAASTVPERRIWGILEGETEHTHYAVADRLCTAMGLALSVIYDDDGRS